MTAEQFKLAPNRIDTYRGLNGYESYKFGFVAQKNSQGIYSNSFLQINKTQLIKAEFIYHTDSGKWMLSIVEDIPLSYWSHALESSSFKPIEAAIPCSKVESAVLEAQTEAYKWPGGKAFVSEYCAERSDKKKHSLRDAQLYSGFSLKKLKNGDYELTGDNKDAPPIDCEPARTTYVFEKKSSQWTFASFTDGYCAEY
jgi:hypothetical protein